MLYTLRTTHTMSATRSIVPRMPPIYIVVSVSWSKSLFEHERRCLSGRYRTHKPKSPDTTAYRLLGRDKACADCACLSVRCHIQAPRKESVLSGKASPDEWMVYD